MNVCGKKVDVYSSMFRSEQFQGVALISRMGRTITVYTENMTEARDFSSCFK